MADQKLLSKFQIFQSRLQSSQFIYQLDVQTLLPLEVAASAVGKSVSTFRSDLIRRPQSLPKVTRRHGRVFVVVSDLINWRDNTSVENATTPPTKKKRGRPTKAEQLARQQAGV